MPLTIYRNTEQELLEGCRKQNRVAQQQVYATYSGKMYALCYRYVKNTMEAEDVMVTSFTKVFERIEQFKNEGSFEGWIRRIVINEALTWIRKNRSLFVEIELNKIEYNTATIWQSDHLEAEDLLQMIQRLPTGYQIVFNLYAIDGYSHKEIAEQLNISENTSKSQLSRARVYLQKLLASQEWGGTQLTDKNETTN